MSALGRQLNDRRRPLCSAKVPFEVPRLGRKQASGYDEIDPEKRIFILSAGISPVATAQIQVLNVRNSPLPTPRRVR